MKEEILKILKEIAVKDFMNGLLTFSWNPEDKNNPYSIYKAVDELEKYIKNKEEEAYKNGANKVE